MLNTGHKIHLYQDHAVFIFIHIPIVRTEDEQAPQHDPATAMCYDGDSC